MKVRPEVKEAMCLLGVEELREHQNKIINSVLDGHDTMVSARTSFGKSLCYLIPAVIHCETITIIIEPLLSLMHDQVNKLSALKKRGIYVDYLDSTQNDCKKAEIYHRIEQGKINILYITPEKLSSWILEKIERSKKIGLIVVDECHCVTAWGYTFREAYQNIGKYIGYLKYRPVIVALSATILPEMREPIQKLLNMRHVKNFFLDLYRSNITYMKVDAPSRKAQQKALKKYIGKYHKKTTIVFCNTRKCVNSVSDYLMKLYPDDVAKYHGKNKKDEKALLLGNKHIIVATSALSMGADIRNVDLVIHFNMPLSMADYYQMSGRAGREGQKARSILLYNPDDYYLNQLLLSDINNEDALSYYIRKLDEMKEFCDDEKHCMVKSMLNALGDDFDHKCRYCTNCQRGRR